MQVCKTCGGNCTRQGNYYVCESCNNHWEVELTENVGAVKLANAWEALRQNDFDKATELFENIIAETPDSHEAYWGRALARNCIVFVNDLNENKKVPTCNNITENSFLQDADVQKAQKLAPPDIAAGYRDMAQKIENIRVEWLEKARKEPPYDVFLCFKDSDKEHGIERTQDSIDAQDLYNALTAEGFKVFFSRVSLRNKLAEQYEPYIYNAIKTAAVMVVFGEKPEYFNAVWLKNEWGRFKTLIEKGDKHKNSLVVVYKDMDPGQLPVVLRNRQCLNYASVTCLMDLTRHIKKVIELSHGAKVERITLEGGQIAKKATTLQTQNIETHEVGQGAIAETSVGEQNMLGLVRTYMKAGKWEEADKLVDELLFENLSYAEAIWEKLRIRFRALSNDDLVERLAAVKKPLSRENLGAIEKCFSCASQQFAAEIGGFLYEKGIAIPGYEQLLKVILPFVFDGRDEMIEKALQQAIDKHHMAAFETLLSTLKFDEVDRYIRYQTAYLKSTPDEQERMQCVARILAVDEGNLAALRYRLKHDIVAHANPQTLQTDLEEILKYTAGGDKQIGKEVEGALHFLASRLDNADHCAFANQVLRYYPGELKALYTLLTELTTRILQMQLFDQAEYFVKLLLSTAPGNADIYWMICLMRVHAGTEEDVVKSDIPLNTVPEYNKYLSLVDEERRLACIALCDKQMSRIKADETRKKKEEAERQAKEEKERKEAEKREARRRYEEEQRRKEARRRALRRAAKLLLFAILAFGAFSVFALNMWILPAKRYQKAEDALKAGQYESAYLLFKDVRVNYKDRSKRMLDLIDAGYIQKIGKKDFCRCSTIKTLTIKDGVTTIGEKAFYKCKNLKTLVIPGSVTTIDEKAFGGCKALIDVTVLKTETDKTSYEKYSSYAFSGSKNIEKAVMPAAVIGRIPTTGLTTVEITAGLNENGGIGIPKQAFRKAAVLQTVVIDAGVTYIGEGAFYDCTNLTDITIPTSVTTIYQAAFHYSGLTGITYKGTKTQWESITKKSGTASAWYSHMGKFTVYCTDATIVMNKN